MKRRSVLASILGAIFVICLTGSPALAQATRTWVSGVGDDANPCSRTAPCKTFPGAISKTAVNGEINCLDPGGFGAVTITKSITISCETGPAGVLVSGTNAIIVNVGPNDTVYLRGLDIQGLGTGLAGINFIGAGVLHVEHCFVRGFSAGTAAGINFAPTGAGELYVSESYIVDNGTGTTGAGVLIQPPAGSGSVHAVLSQLHVENNSYGIKVNNPSSTGTVIVSVVDTVTAGNTGPGLAAFSGAGKANVMIDRLTASTNQIGVRSDGGTTIVYLGNSVITGNGTGLSITNGGQLQSYKTNQINGNSTNGAPSSVIGLN